MAKYLYKVVSNDITHENTVRNIQDLMDRLDSGWTIISSVGVPDGIHYILEKKNGTA